MPTRLNLGQNLIFAAPTGASFGLSQQSDLYASGAVPRSALSITATVKADKQADVHLALYSAPLLVGAADSALITQVDALAVLNTYQDLTLTIPITSTLVQTPIVQDGAITITSGSAAIVGAATAFPTDGQWAGYEISVKGAAWQQISSVTSATALTLTANAAASSAGAFYVRRPMPTAFVIVIWADNIVGGTVETVIRDPAITVASSQPQVPGGVTVSQMVVA